MIKKELKIFCDNCENCDWAVDQSIKSAELLFLTKGWYKVGDKHYCDECYNKLFGGKNDKTNKNSY